MGQLKRELWTFLKAQLSAVLATAVDFGLSFALAEWCGVWYALASFAGAAAGGVTNCAVNYRWVFMARGLDKNSVAVKYAFVWLGSILLNTLGTYVVTELSGAYFMLGKAVVAVIVAVGWNYQLQRRWVFGGEEGKELRS